MSREPSPAYSGFEGGAPVASRFVVAVVAVPSGIAVGQSVTGSEISGGMSVPAAECPAATAEFERAGLPHPEEYADRCPTAERVEELVESVRQAVEAGWRPSQ